MSDVYVPFLGMHGNGSWGDDVRPKSFREGINFLFPNGDAALTEILAMTPGERVYDTEHSWWLEGLPVQASAVTGIYTDVSLATAYTSGGVAGDILYVKMAAADVVEYKISHMVEMRAADDFQLNVTAVVTGREVNGANSFVAVKLKMADTTTTIYSGDLSDADRILIIGSQNAQGSAIPDPVNYKPVKYKNYTTIFMTASEITRTAARTKTRTGSEIANMHKRAMRLHSIEIEKSLWHSTPQETTGENGQPETSMIGILPIIRGDFSGFGGPAGNVYHYPSDSGIAADTTWIAGGEAWLDSKLEELFRYGSKTKVAFCGSEALLAINNLAKYGQGQFSYTPMTAAYGIKVVEWVTAHGTIYLKSMPLWNIEPTMRKNMAVIDTDSIKWRFIDDTTFVKGADVLKKPANWTDRDAQKDWWLTEATLEFGETRGWGYFQEMGVVHDAA